MHGGHGGGLAGAGDGGHDTLYAPLIQALWQQVQDGSAHAAWEQRPRAPGGAAAVAAGSLITAWLAPLTIKAVDGLGVEHSATIVIHRVMFDWVFGSSIARHVLDPEASGGDGVAAALGGGGGGSGSGGSGSVGRGPASVSSPRRSAGPVPAVAAASAALAPASPSAPASASGGGGGLGSPVVVVGEAAHPSGAAEGSVVAVDPEVAAAIAAADALEADDAAARRIAAEETENHAAAADGPTLTLVRTSPCCCCHSALFPPPPSSFSLDGPAGSTAYRCAFGDVHACTRAASLWGRGAKCWRTFSWLLISPSLPLARTTRLCVCVHNSSTMTTRTCMW
jgi:hypothetical protein